MWQDHCRQNFRASSDAAPEDSSDGPEVVPPPPQGLARTRQRDPPAAEAPAVKAAAPATRGLRVRCEAHGGWKNFDAFFPFPASENVRKVLCGDEEPLFKKDTKCQ